MSELTETLLPKDQEPTDTDELTNVGLNEESSPPILPLESVPLPDDPAVIEGDMMTSPPPIQRDNIEESVLDNLPESNKLDIYTDELLLEDHINYIKDILNLYTFQHLKHLLNYFIKKYVNNI